MGLKEEVSRYALYVFEEFLEQSSAEVQIFSLKNHVRCLMMCERFEIRPHSLKAHNERKFHFKEYFALQSQSTANALFFLVGIAFVKILFYICVNSCETLHLILTK